MSTSEPLCSPRWRTVPLAGAVVGSLLLSAGAARADVSSWLYLGAGPHLAVEDGSSSEPLRLTLDLDTGMGTDPSSTIIVGGLARLQTHFDLGTDFSVAVRTATHGYVNGDWGLALDLGAFQRLTANVHGPAGALALGAPWGITLAATVASDLDGQTVTAAVLGIDLARLTVYRTTGGQWWPNPLPAYRPGDP